MASSLPYDFDAQQSLYTSRMTSDQAIPPLRVTSAQQKSGISMTSTFDPSVQSDMDLFVTSDQVDPTLEQSMFESSWPASPENNFTGSIGYSPLANNEALKWSTNSQQQIEDDPLFLTASTTSAVSSDSLNFEPPKPAVGHTAQPLPSLQPKPPGGVTQSSTKSELVEPSGRRIAHNLVERKYRDTLNSELERLRRAVPSIRNLDSETPDGRPRASKATVLSAATEYINKLEAEIDSLAAEIERLNEDGARPTRRRRQCI